MIVSNYQSVFVAYESKNNIDVTRHNVLATLEGQRIRYMGYGFSHRFDSSRQVWESVKLIELVCRRVPLLVECYQYHQRHPDKRVPLISGPNDVVTLPVEEKFYRDHLRNDTATYLILPDELYVSEFPNVSVDQLEDFIYRASQEPDVILVPESLPCIAIVREIFTQTKELSILHPTIEMVNPQKLDSNVPYPRINNYERYSISFQPIPKACGYSDCPLCMRDITLLDEPMLITIGKLINDPEVQRANAKFQARRRRIKKQMREARMYLQALQVFNATYDVLDASDEGNEDIRAEALKELENGVVEEGEEERGKMSKNLSSSAESSAPSICD